MDLNWRGGTVPILYMLSIAFADFLHVQADLSSVMLTARTRSVDGESAQVVMERKSMVP